MGRNLLVGSIFLWVSGRLWALEPAKEVNMFVDGFGGVAHPERVSFLLSQEEGSGWTTVRGTSRARTAPGGGARLGAWGPGKSPWGAGFEVSGFGLKSPEVNGEAYLTSFFIAGRVPLGVSDRFPAGRWQPYGRVGISSVILRVSIRSAPLAANIFYKGFLPSFNASGQDVSRAIWSPYLAAGVSWGITKDWYLFGEWHRTEFHTRSDTVNSVFWPTRRGTLELSVRSNQYHLGLSRRFVVYPKPRPLRTRGQSGSVEAVPAENKP